jgi:RNA polymerase-binding transcription factor DksA
MSQCTVARLSSNELHELTVLLCAERESVAKRRDALRADMSAAMESIDASDLFDAAPSDPDLSERTTSLLLMAEAEIRLEEIERAFARIERETYGACDACGEEIPHTRLLAVPTSPYCVSCAGGNPSRPAESIDPIGRR